MIIQVFLFHQTLSKHYNFNKILHMIKNIFFSKKLTFPNLKNMINKFSFIFLETLYVLLTIFFIFTQHTVIDYKTQINIIIKILTDLTIIYIY